MFSFDLTNCPLRGSVKNAPYLLNEGNYGILSAVGMFGQFAGCCGSAAFFKGDEEYFKKSNIGIQVLITDQVQQYLENTEDYTYVIVPTAHGIIHVKLNVGGYDRGDTDWIPKHPEYPDELDNDFCLCTGRTIYLSFGTTTKAKKDQLTNHRICAIHLDSQGKMLDRQREYYRSNYPNIDMEWVDNAAKKTAELFDAGDILMFITTPTEKQNALLQNQLEYLGEYKYLYESDYVYNGNYLRDADGTPRLKLHIVEKG